MKNTEINKILAVLSATYQNYQLNEISSFIWQEVLAEITYEQAREAVIEFLKSNSAFAPAPGQILAIAKDKLRAGLIQNQRDYKHFEIPRNSYKGNLRDALTPEGLEKLLKLTVGGVKC